MATGERNPVTQGGMWSTPKASYSKQTHDLLKNMMRESKLTNFQQRQLDKAMHGGSSLPSKCHPTSSAKSRLPDTKSKRPQSKILNAKNCDLQIRTKDQIEASGAYEIEKYAPGPASFYESDKKRLINMMAYGEDIAPPERPVVVRKTAPQKNVDRFEELENEITERREFLGKMEGLGQGAKYRTVIETEISQKIREMEVIDKKRTNELEKLLAKEKAEKET